MQRLFDHEKLDVYQASLALIVWLEPILQKLPKSLSARTITRTITKGEKETSEMRTKDTTNWTARARRSRSTSPKEMGNSRAQIVVGFLTSRAVPLWRARLP